MTEQPVGNLIDIGLCTFRRPQVVETLGALARLDVPAGYRLRVIVADNDETPSARAAVEAAGMPHELLYVHAPARNISIARNACLDAGTGAWLAFIDDDETAPPHWIAALLERARESGADAVFGPVRAVYGPDAPDWMRAQDHHSTSVAPRGGRIETGYAGNVLLRRHDVPWMDARFDLGRGRTGGEDTDYFHRLHRQGARYALAETAVVEEPVAEGRLSFDWLRRRKFRTGQNYAVSAMGGTSRWRLLASAGAKAVYCTGRAVLSLARPGPARFWLLRAAFHGGVCAGCLSIREDELYGR